VVDNVVDMAHFFYIHFAFPTFFKNVLEGHVAAQYLTTKSRPDVSTGSNYADGGETTLRSEAAYYGPSYMIDYLSARLPRHDDAERADQTVTTRSRPILSCSSGARS